MYKKNIYIYIPFTSFDICVCFYFFPKLHQYLVFLNYSYWPSFLFFCQEISFKIRQTVTSFDKDTKHSFIFFLFLWISIKRYFLYLMEKADTQKNKKQIITVLSDILSLGNIIALLKYSLPF
jgi:hypothetical protein